MAMGYVSVLRRATWSPIVCALYCTITVSVLQTTFTYYVFRFYCSLFLGYVRSGGSQAHVWNHWQKQIYSHSMDNIGFNSAPKLQCHLCVWSFDSSLSQLAAEVDDKTTKYGLRRAAQVISQGLMCHQSLRKTVQYLTSLLIIHLCCLLLLLLMSF